MISNGWGFTEREGFSASKLTHERKLNTQKVLGYFVCVESFIYRTFIYLNINIDMIF